MLQIETVLRALLVAVGIPLSALFGGTVVLSGLDTGQSATTMGELVTVLETVGENWRGIAIIAIICIGPLFWVVRAQMSMQERESQENRKALRELANSQERIYDRIEASHRATNEAVVSELRQVSMSLARMDGSRGRQERNDRDRD